MAALRNGFVSPPIGTERKMAGLRLLQSTIQADPASMRAEDLSELSGLVADHGEEDEEEERHTDEEYEIVQRDEARDIPSEFLHSYGTMSPGSRRRRRRKRKKSWRRRSGSLTSYSPLLPSPRPRHYHHHHQQHPYFSLSPQVLREGEGRELEPGVQRAWGSTSAISQNADYNKLITHHHHFAMTTDQDDDNEDSHSSSDTSSEEDEPPIMELFYRRTCKDKVKLIVIPLLYFMFFAIAGVFAFYSIEALVLSYNHRVRTASYITVEEYAPIGIAVFPQDFATYEGCQFKYGDDLSPHGGNWTPLTPADVLDNCSTFINVTFTSSLVNENRTAMVFRGPTRVNLKQSLWLNFSIDTTKREFGAMEFLIFSDWRDLNAMTAAQRASYLAQEEAKEPLYTLPAGFRSWVKIYKIMRHDGATKTNLSDFYLITDFSKYNDPRPPENRTSDPLLVLFEWKSPTYEYIEDILSTTIWNTLGSLAGVFVTLIKAGEYFYAWVKRMRRERRKKLLKLQEIEEERQRMMAEYELKREERRRQKLAESQEKLNNVVKEGVMSQ